jgi:hypothetical protein
VLFFFSRFDPIYFPCFHNILQKISCKNILKSSNINTFFVHKNMKIQTLIILVVEHVIVIVHLVKSLVVHFFNFEKV